MTPAIEALRSAGIEYRLHSRPTAGSTCARSGSGRLPTTVDEAALAHETILVSAGRRGLQLELDPRELVRLTAAEVRAVARG